MSVPIIDITPLLRNNNSLDARSCSDKIHKLCSEIGFLVITGHGIEKDLDQIFEIAKEFKKLPKSPIFFSPILMSLGNSIV